MLPDDRGELAVDAAVVDPDDPDVVALGEQAEPELPADPSEPSVGEIR